MNRLSFMILLMGMCFVLNVSCSRQIKKLAVTDELVIYPPPPDTTRIQYLTRISSSLDITGKRSAFARFVLGEFKKLDIIKPYGITIHNGKIYICDTGLDALEVIDLQKHSFEYFIPGGRGQLMKPLNCFVDENGYLFIADGGRKQVVIFDGDSKYVNSFGETENFKPTDVFVKENKIWVTNFEDNKIYIYSRDNYTLIDTFPEAEQGSEDFLYSPTNIFVTDDKIFVSDFGDFKIKAYNHDREFLFSVGSYGDKLGQFVRPKGIAVDKESNLYVVDAGFENTQIFSKDGKLLMFFGGPYKNPGDMWLPAKVIIDYDNLQYFESYVDKGFNLKYLIFVTNQYGPDKVNVYGYVEPK